MLVDREMPLVLRVLIVSRRCVAPCVDHWNVSENCSMSGVVVAVSLLNSFEVLIEFRVQSEVLFSISGEV